MAKKDSGPNFWVFIPYSQPKSLIIQRGGGTSEITYVLKGVPANAQEHGLITLTSAIDRFERKHQLSKFGHNQLNAYASLNNGDYIAVCGVTGENILLKAIDHVIKSEFKDFREGIGVNQIADNHILSWEIESFYFKGLHPAKPEDIPKLFPPEITGLPIPDHILAVKNTNKGEKTVTALKAEIEELRQLVEEKNSKSPRGISSLQKELKSLQEQVAQLSGAQEAIGRQVAANAGSPLPASREPVEHTSKEEVNAQKAQSPPYYYRANGTIPVKNLILHGPPGTGKTRRAMQEAVAIITGDDSRFTGWETDYGDGLDFGQIEFVTFHPNYSYEDFMAGVSADLESEQLKFRRKEGIFYQLAKRALNNWQLSREDNTPTLAGFEARFEQLMKPLDEEDQPIRVRMVSGKFFTITRISE